MTGVQTCALPISFIKADGRPGLEAHKPVAKSANTRLDWILSIPCGYRSVRKRI